MDRRGFLECMTWAGTGLVWTMAGGVAASSVLGGPRRAASSSSHAVSRSSAYSRIVASMRKRGSPSNWAVERIRW